MIRRSAAGSAPWAETADAIVMDKAAAKTVTDRIALDRVVRSGSRLMVRRFLWAPSPPAIRLGDPAAVPPPDLCLNVVSIVALNPMPR
jgi:hypothetical protein